MRIRLSVLLTLVVVALAAWLLVVPPDPEEAQDGDGEVIRREPEAAGGPEPSPRPTPVRVETAAEAPPPEPEAYDPLAWGALFFDDAIRYVSRGGTPISTLRTLYLDLDARIDTGQGVMKGEQRIWLETPSRLRVEHRVIGALTTRILDGEAGWLVDPDGVVVDLADGDGLRDLARERDRAARLASLLTLASLKGPGITFRFEGYTKGSGTYEGHWLRVTRQAPNPPRLTFWLGWEKDTHGDVQATWPGIVRVEDDPLEEGTVDYLLRAWENEDARMRRPYRYPRRIEAYRLTRSPRGDMLPSRIQFALVNDVKINVDLATAHFASPR